MQQWKLVPSIQLSVRAAVAALLAVAVARYFGLQPLQALVTSVLVIDLSPEETRRLALPRFVGTLLGGALGALLSMALPSNPVSIGLGVLAAMLSSHLLRLDRASRLSGYVCGIILLREDGALWAYAFDRLLETTVGIVMAVLTSFVPKLMRAEGEP